ncbi:hypothetical protein HPP92_025957 [Vanilla planifolia]|uniref:Uncharacterized protein n=1 Tax=Vanilla planifolia TaxID=51239 RepID=A0A835UA89_VANPL|nr:hypothetical protein HPP92_025957 [Vanilla planifolia]
MGRGRVAKVGEEEGWQKGKQWEQEEEEGLGGGGGRGRQRSRRWRKDKHRGRWIRWRVGAFEE